MRKKQGQLWNVKSTPQGTRKVPLTSHGTSAFPCLSFLRSVSWSDGTDQTAQG
jgi:hypothetical protein